MEPVDWSTVGRVMRGDNAMGNTTILCRSSNFFMCHFCGRSRHHENNTSSVCFFHRREKIFKSEVTGNNFHSVKRACNTQRRRGTVCYSNCMFACRLCFTRLAIARPAHNMLTMNLCVLRVHRRAVPALLTANYGIGKLNFDCSIALGECDLNWMWAGAENADRKFNLQL